MIKTAYWKGVNIAGLSLLLALASGGALAAEEAIGKVILTSGEFYAVEQDKDKRDLKRKAELYEGDTLHTGENTQAQVRFTDNSLVSLGPNTIVSLDDYNFESATSQNNKYEATLVQGTYRTVTGYIGKTNRDAYSVRSKLANIGVMGTCYSTKFIPKEGQTFGVCADNISITTSDETLHIGDDNPHGFAGIDSGSTDVVGSTSPLDVGGFPEEPPVPGSDPSPPDDGDPQTNLDEITGLPFLDPFDPAGFVFSNHHDLDKPRMHQALMDRETQTIAVVKKAPSLGTSDPAPEAINLIRQGLAEDGFVVWTPPSTSPPGDIIWGAWAANHDGTPLLVHRFPNDVELIPNGHNFYFIHGKPSALTNNINGTYHLETDEGVGGVIGEGHYMGTHVYVTSAEGTFLVDLGANMVTSVEGLRLEDSGNNEWDSGPLNAHFEGNQIVFSPVDTRFAQIGGSRGAVVNGDITGQVGGVIAGTELENNHLIGGFEFQSVIDAESNIGGVFFTGPQDTGSVEP